MTRNSNKEQGTVMNKIRAGVVGVGYLGQFHAEKYSKLPNVELVGVADPDRTRGEHIAHKLGTRAFTSAADLLGAVDAVSIVVPTVLHHKTAKLFLEQGVHVLLEKPITVTVEQADELIGLAAGNGLVLQVGHIERFNPAVTAVKSLLRSPRYIQAERSAPFTVRCTDVNVILDLMIHDLDIVIDLAGSEPRELSAVGVSIITREIDSVIARIIFRNGCVADVTTSRVSDEKKRMLRIFDGETLYTSDYQAQKAFRSQRGAGPVPEFVTAEIPTVRSDTLYEEVRSFVQCVEQGTRPLVSGIEGKKALALARFISETVEKGITGFVPAGNS
jgi:predicted dehydrogenase